MSSHDISQARACKLVCVDPKTGRRKREPDNPAIRRRLREIAPERRPPVDTNQALELLASDAVDAEEAVRRYSRAPLEQHQFDALVSFTFNLGAGAPQASTLRRVINRGDHASAPAQLRRWVYAGGRKLRGLVRRRAAEAEMYAL